MDCSRWQPEEELIQRQHENAALFALPHALVPVQGGGDARGLQHLLLDDGCVTARLTATMGGVQGTHGGYKILGGTGALGGSYRNRHPR